MAELAASLQSYIVKIAPGALSTIGGAHKVHGKTCAILTLRLTPSFTVFQNAQVGVTTLRR